MKRAPLGNTAYWDGRVKKFSERIAADRSNMGFPSKNPRSEAEFWFNHSRYNFRLIMLRYSRGDAVETLLGRSFLDLLEGWEHSNMRAREWEQVTGKPDNREWRLALDNLNFYNWCFWVAGLALLFEVPDEQWQRLLVLVGSGGQDKLLDKLLATRQPGRKIGTALLHPKPYARLLRVIEPGSSSQGAALFDFVQHWYAELARKPEDALWWHAYGDPVRHPLEKGSYFGRWCIEAVVVAKVFGVDDSLCLAEDNYPGALLHPESEHVATFQENTLFNRLKRFVLPA
jgi:hypothetical protein